MNFIEELKWRGLFYDMIPETENYLLENKARGYIGFDPTAPSLGIGNLVQIIILMHFQRAGHQPIALIGGATGMIGDPSGKSAERNLLSKEQMEINIENVKVQLSRFLDFEDKNNPALLINNYDWYKDLNVLDFLRNVGKHLTVNYMMAKDSVKSRLETGISYTEFSYQLLQAYDYYILNKDFDCKVQMGGSDQWGNLTAGVELIRRMGGSEVYAVTSPLVTKADGSKFGKTESGNVYLGEEMTSSYKFYQFWLNVSDVDAESFIKIFTFLSGEEIDSLIASHHEAPHLRILQKRLAEEITIMVHSKAALEKAKQASNILFGKSTKEMLQSLSEKELLEIFEGVPSFNVSKSWFENGINILDLLGEKAPVFKSKGEARRMVKDRGLRVNKEIIENHEQVITIGDLLNHKHLIVQKGKKNYYLLEVK
jgi:tyrosyl-tRNA synthetase